VTNPFRRWHVLRGKIVRVAAADANTEAKTQAHLVCAGHDDENQINVALQEFVHPDGNWTIGEIRRKREWRWSWQPEIKVTTLGEGGTVLLSDGVYSITNPINLKDWGSHGE